MQSCWDDGCFNSGLRPREVIVVWWLPWVGTKMIRLHAYKHLASQFTQVRTLFFHYFVYAQSCVCLFGSFCTYREYTGTYSTVNMDEFVCLHPWLVQSVYLFSSDHYLLCSLFFLHHQSVLICDFSLFSHLMSSLPDRVTREHRENLVKLAKQFSNKAKDSLRRVRSNAVTQVKKAKEGHSEDTIRLVEKQV